ncbi:MAG: hypothetical protein LPK14_15340 [Hymenobacteraceae bacterium]|nr:hypothetical protein [Hymenobacteraceae bacterium]
MKKEEKITRMLEQCKARPITTTEEERQEREWWSKTASGILISEGHQDTELDRQIDQLHINGQITRAEREEILLLRCL